ncbi:MAG: hypothetical protein HY901_36210 [Deltaproteobacteria bacterium]|nr:hypothetical protein [Deltaproteobacteria bacterium]
MPMTVIIRTPKSPLTRKIALALLVVVRGTPGSAGRTGSRLVEQEAGISPLLLGPDRHRVAQAHRGYDARVKLRAPTALAIGIWLLAPSAALLGCASGWVQSKETDKSHGYVPADLDDCFAELKKTMSLEEQTLFAALPSQTETIQHHFGLGLWIRNNWGLRRGSRLALHMESLGFREPDAMSKAILEYYWLHLNGRLPGARQEVDLVRKYWERFDDAGHAAERATDAGRSP